MIWESEDQYLNGKFHFQNLIINFLIEINHLNYNLDLKINENKKISMVNLELEY